MGVQSSKKLWTSPFKKTLVWIQEHRDNKEKGKMLSVNRQHSDFRNVEKAAVSSAICKELE